MSHLLDACVCRYIVLDTNITSDSVLSYVLDENVLEEGYYNLSAKVSMISDFGNLIADTVGKGIIAQTDSYGVEVQVCMLFDALPGLSSLVLQRPAVLVQSETALVLQVMPLLITSTAVLCHKTQVTDLSLAAIQQTVVGRGYIHALVDVSCDKGPLLFCGNLTALV